jgi:hypothetical protein
MTFGGSAPLTTCTMIPEHQLLVIVNKWRNTCYFQIPKNHVPAVSTASTVYNTYIHKRNYMNNTHSRHKNGWLAILPLFVCKSKESRSTGVLKCTTATRIIMCHYKKKSVWCSDHLSTELFPIFPRQRQLNSSFLLKCNTCSVNFSTPGQHIITQIHSQ